MLKEDKTAKQATEIVPDFNLEIFGESCPYPAIATLEAMEQLELGQILEVITDCPQSINNIPPDTKSHGYQLLAVEQQGPNLRYVIQK